MAATLRRSEEGGFSDPLIVIVVLWCSGHRLSAVPNVMWRLQTYVGELPRGLAGLISRHNDCREEQSPNPPFTPFLLHQNGDNVTSTSMGMATGAPSSQSWITWASRSVGLVEQWFRAAGRSHRRPEFRPYVSGGVYGALVRNTTPWLHANGLPWTTQARHFHIRREVFL